MTSLIIGDTSQLSYYFPSNYQRVSSRNLNIHPLRQEWDRIYLSFGKQNVFEENDTDFLQVNTYYTLDIIDKLLDYCNNIVVFTTCEMYNDYKGYVSIKTYPRFKLNKQVNYNNYIISKFLLWRIIQTKRTKDTRWSKVIIVNPFSFESSRKSKYFLFGKITDSIINKKKIDVGNLDFYRDFVHTRFVTERLISCHDDIVIGSGKIFNVREVIRDLYHAFNLPFEDMVNENKNTYPSDRFIRAQVDWSYSYDDLMSDLILDIKQRL